jgi:hypothetical protein
MRAPTLAIAAVMLCAVGAALLLAAELPRPASAQWVGGVSHGAHFSAAVPLNLSQMNGARS